MSTPLHQCYLTEATESAPTAPTAPNSVQLPPDPIDLYPAGTTVQVYWEGEKKWYTGNITKTDVWRGPNGLSKQAPDPHFVRRWSRQGSLTPQYQKVRTVVPSEAETGVEEVSVAAGTSGSSADVQFDMPPSWPNSPVNTPRPQPDPPSQPPSNGTAPAAAALPPPSQQFDMPPSWPNSPVNTPRPQPDPPSQPPSNGTAPAAAAPSSPSNRPGTPQTMNNQGQPAAPDLPSFLPAHLKVINESGVTPSFIHHGEKV